jgi:hypothetical protein
VKNFGYPRSPEITAVFAIEVMRRPFKRAYFNFCWGVSSTCGGPSQRPLKYGVDDYSAQTVGLPLNPPADESLSDAICCDQTYYG